MKRVFGSAVFAVSLAIMAGCGASSEDAAVDGVETVLFTTELGTITLEIDTVSAPVSATHFLKHVNGGHYDGASFYRVVRPDNEYNPRAPIEVIQGGLFGEVFGDVDGDELDDVPVPFDAIPHETTQHTGLSNLRGTIAWARGAPGSARSEFFINVTDNGVLDTGPTERNPDGAGYAVFGQVVDGMDVVEVIQSGATVGEQGSDMANQVLDAPVVIRRAERVD